MKITNVEEVHKLYDDLLPWDKSSFIEKHVEDLSSMGEEDLIDFLKRSISKNIYTEDEVSEFVRDHWASEILAECSCSELVEHLADECDADELADYIQSRVDDTYEIKFLSEYLESVDPKNLKDALGSLSDKKRKTFISILTGK